MSRYYNGNLYYRNIRAMEPGLGHMLNFLERLTREVNRWRGNEKQKKRLETENLEKLKVKVVKVEPTGTISNVNGVTAPESIVEVIDENPHKTKQAKVIDVDLEAITIWVFGDKEKNEALIKLLGEFGILEIAKTGTIAIERGRSTIYDDNKLQEEFNYGKNVL